MEISEKAALFDNYIIHFHGVNEDVRCVKKKKKKKKREKKKVGLLVVGVCVPRCDTGAQRRVRRLRDSLTPGRADPTHAERARRRGR